MKKSGILLPISSLPSRAGIGEFGESALDWLDILEENNIKIWQILPLNPLGYGNSPYQPYSSFAGDEIYISLEELKKEGLLDIDILEYEGSKNKVDYVNAREYKNKYLERAFLIYKSKGFSKGLFSEEEFSEFKKQKWLNDYKDFCLNKYKDLVFPRYLDKKESSKELFEEYIVFLQYIFYKQWFRVKEYANNKNILIMGDVPFYVGLDSADVFSEPENFLLDKNLMPTFIAGVPPDYFSKTGQRWGNPIYNWDYIKKNDYKFWTDRIGYNAKLFDIVRVDHFRAFDTYWKVPVSCPTAIEGEWIEAPGYETIEKILSVIKDKELVAEDLGELRKEVRILKDYFGLKGMKIFEFGFDFSRKYAKEVNVPLDWEKIIYYTGTHDNATLKEWYYSLSKSSRRKLRKFLTRKGFSEGNISSRVIKYILKSKAEYAIISLPDILECNKEGRINTPGTVGSPNWEWQLSSLGEVNQKINKYKKYFNR
jgi:4-alpha-glucanotransferase